MQIYSKSHKMLRTSFLNPFWFGLLYLIELIGGFKNLYTEFQNSLIMQIYATNLCKFIQNHKKYLFFITFVNWFLFGLLYLVELSLVRQASTQNL